MLWFPKLRWFPQKKIKSHHCEAALYLQVPELCTDLDLNQESPLRSSIVFASPEVVHISRMWLGSQLVTLSSRSLRKYLHNSFLLIDRDNIYTLGTVGVKRWFLSVLLMIIQRLNYWWSYNGFIRCIPVQILQYQKGKHCFRSNASPQQHTHPSGSRKWWCYQPDAWWFEIVYWERRPWVHCKFPLYNCNTPRYVSKFRHLLDWLMLL